MISATLTRIAAVAASIAISTTTAEAWPHRGGQKAHVRFLATSTVIRGTFGQNEDTYLAELTFTREGDPLMVRLVDAYPNEAPPLTIDALISDTGTALRVRRDPRCDRPYGELLLRTAPGDPMAILLEPLHYTPRSHEMPKANAILLCYRTLR